MNRSQTHYQRLNVATDATFEQICKAFHQQAIKCHLEANPDCKDEATARFKLLQAAYLVLLSPLYREIYDREMGLNVPQHTSPRKSNASGPPTPG